MGVNRKGRKEKRRKWERERGREGEIERGGGEEGAMVQREKEKDQ